MSTIPEQPRYFMQVPGGDVYGPETMLTLLAWAREGRMTAETLVAQVGTDQWQRADSYRELRAVFQTPESRALEALEGLGGGGDLPPRTATRSTVDVGYSGPRTFARQTTNGYAVTSLVMGIVGLLVCPIIFSVLAIIFSVQAKSQIRASRGREGGEGLATAGLVLGIVGIPLGCLAGMALSGRHF